MNVRRIGRIGLIGALAAALASPWRPVAGQQAMTCASEPYLARVVTGGATGTPTAVGPATPAAVASPPASPPASPAGSPAASPAATPRPLTLAWLPGQSEAEATSAAREAATATQARLLEPDSGDPQESLQTAIKGGAQAVVAASKTAAAIAPELTAAAGDGVAIVTLGPDDAADGRTLNVVAPDGPAVATAAAQWLADQLGCAGEVLILSGSSDDAALNDKATAAAAEFAAYGVRVVDVVYG
ncbi:MAG TPA: substrate-binding domain-containing protein, partial [Thermomicrobiales bacterium]|nr:substrate-binding domain-containing protein [Thermomicrobiales bacterium]